MHRTPYPPPARPKRWSCRENAPYYTQSNQSTSFDMVRKSSCSLSGEKCTLHYPAQPTRFLVQYRARCALSPTTYCCRGATTMYAQNTQAPKPYSFVVHTCTLRRFSPPSRRLPTASDSLSVSLQEAGQTLVRRIISHRTESMR